MIKHAALPEDIFLLKGSLHDEPVWYYVRVGKQQQPLLKKMVGEGDADPAAFGTILFHGPGEEPPLYYREKIAKGDFS